MTRRKVIGLSLPRTGNQSMHAALRMLGYQNVAHDPVPLESIAQADAVTEARYPPRELYRLYPDALFVFLVRDVEAWVRSCERVVAGGHVQPHWNPFWKAPACLWPTLYWERLRQCLTAVPPGQLLAWNIRDGWLPLCGALCLPVPEQPFPRVDAYARPAPPATLAEVPAPGRAIT